MILSFLNGKYYFCISKPRLEYKIISFGINYYIIIQETAEIESKLQQSQSYQENVSQQPQMEDVKQLPVSMRGGICQGAATLFE